MPLYPPQCALHIARCPPKADRLEFASQTPNPKIGTEADFGGRCGCFYFDPGNGHVNPGFYHANPSNSYFGLGNFRYNSGNFHYNPRNFHYNPSN
jgi:hypothetical protein